MHNGPLAYDKELTEDDVDDFFSLLQALQCKDNPTAITILEAKPYLCSQATQKGTTPLIAAVCLATCVDSDIFERLIHNPYTDLNAIDTNGNSALHFMAEKNHPGLMSLFLKQEKQKINIDALTFKDDAVDNQFSSVYMASLNGNDICLRLLLAHGADPNLPSGVLKWSPLHAACINGHADCVYDLLEAGANPDALDAQGGTALHNLASAPNITPEDFQKIEQWFVQASAKFNVKLKGYMPDQLAANAGHQLAIVFSESLKFHKVPSLKAMCQTVLASQGTVLQGDFAPRFHRK